VSEDIWHSEDVQPIILAAAQANKEAPETGLMGTDPARSTAYRQGYRAALSTMALALGLPTLPPGDSEGECPINSPMLLAGGGVCSRLSGTSSMGLASPLPPTREESSYADRPAVVR